jgi:hypothetical protein
VPRRRSCGRRSDPSSVICYDDDDDDDMGGFASLQVLYVRVTGLLLPVACSLPELSIDRAASRSVEVNVVLFACLCD